jgi:hypothetical protein
MVPSRSSVPADSHPDIAPTRRKALQHVRLAGATLDIVSGPARHHGATRRVQEGRIASRRAMTRFTSSVTTDSLPQGLWASLSRAWLELSGEPPRPPPALPAGMQPR